MSDLRGATPSRTADAPAVPPAPAADSAASPFGLLAAPAAPVPASCCSVAVTWRPYFLAPLRFRLGLVLLAGFFLLFPLASVRKAAAGGSSMANCAMVLMLQKSLPRVRTRVSRQLMSPSPQRPVTPALVLIPSALSVTSAGHLKSPYLQRLTP